MKVDLPCDVQQVDETGYVWAYLSEARNPSGIVPGQTIVAGSDAEPVHATVIDIVGDLPDQIVHLNITGVANEVEGDDAEFVADIHWESNEGVPQTLLNLEDFNPAHVYPGAKVRVGQAGGRTFGATVTSTSLEWVDSPAMFKILVKYLPNSAEWARREHAARADPGESTDRAFDDEG